MATKNLYQKFVASKAYKKLVESNKYVNHTVIVDRKNDDSCTVTFEHFGKTDADILTKWVNRNALSWNCHSHLCGANNIVIHIH